MKFGIKALNRRRQEYIMDLNEKFETKIIVIYIGISFIIFQQHILILSQYLLLFILYEKINSWVILHFLSCVFVFPSTAFKGHLGHRNDVFPKVFITCFEGFEPRKKSFFLGSI